MRDRWITYPALRRMGPEALLARIAESPREAARWVEGAALNGIVNAQLAWGQMQLDGHGVPRDPEAALRWFRIAAGAGSLDALNMVGRCHEFGWGTVPDRAAAAAHYREAAQAGHAWAMFNLAGLLLSGGAATGDRREALVLYVRAARRRNVKAMTMIGRYLEQGWDRPARAAAARRWYRRGAEGGDYRGQFDHARLLMEDGAREEALMWFARSVEGASPAFCRHVAEGLRENPDPALRRLALRALERTSETGDVADLDAYAAALAAGWGAPPDPERADALAAQARTAASNAAQAAVRPRRKPRRLAAVRRRWLTVIGWLRRPWRAPPQQRRPNN